MKGKAAKVLAALNSVLVTAAQWWSMCILWTLGFEFILGINGISALGGVTILPSLATRVGSAKTDEQPVCAVATQLEKPVCAVATQLENPVCAVATQ